MRRGSYFALFLTLAAASAATAQTPLASSSPVPGGILRMTGFGGDESEEAKKARAFQHLRVPGTRVSRAVKKVRKLKWHSSLSKARRQAKRSHKPILWIQALGRLKSYT